MKYLLSLILLAFQLSAATITIDCGSTSDQYFTGGAVTSVVTAGATGDTTIRYGAFSYKITVPDGPYAVALYFRETGTIAAAGQRKFSVKLNEQPAVLQDWDLYAVAGLNPVTRKFLTFTVDGAITIAFSYSKKSAIVSAISVTPLADLMPIPAPIPPVVTASFPAVAERWKCQSGDVLGGPVAPGVPPGAMWPGIGVQSVDTGGYTYNCNGLEYYKFTLADGSITGPWVAVKMPDAFLPDPSIWVKQ